MTQMTRIALINHSAMRDLSGMIPRSLLRITFLLFIFIKYTAFGQYDYVCLYFAY
jgi:hypothetical protein